MKVLIACECSGRIRDAFRKKGHDAWSCDLKPDDEYGDQKDYSVLIQELKDHQINHKFGESN